MMIIQNIKAHIHPAQPFLHQIHQQNFFFFNADGWWSNKRGNIFHKPWRKKNTTVKDGYTKYTSTYRRGSAFMKSNTSAKIFFFQC